MINYWKYASVVILILAPIISINYQITYGTNESSYKYGYNAAVGTYQCRVIEGGCDAIPPGITPPLLPPPPL